MKWTDKIATAEVGNIPYGAIFWASLAETGEVLLLTALRRKWPTSAELAKWGDTLVGTAGAVLVPQGKKFLGEATAKSLAIGFGNRALAPWMENALNKILFPTPPVTVARKQTAQRQIAGRSNPGPNLGSKVDLNGDAGARELNAMV